MTDATNGEAILPPLPEPDIVSNLGDGWKRRDYSIISMREYALAAVKADRERRQPIASAGMVVVPREPTAWMLAEMADCFDPTWGYPDASIGIELARKAYAAMLAAHESQLSHSSASGGVTGESQNRQVREDSQGLGEPGRLPPIDTDVEYDRHYIPLPGGWEIQTKGKGSSFRLCDTKSGRRMVMTGHHFEHEELERMAREIHAAVNMSPPADTTPDVSERGQEKTNDR